MVKVLKFIEGKKTYAIAIAVGLLTAAEFMGWIDTATAVFWYGILGAGGLASLRDAVNRNQG